MILPKLEEKLAEQDFICGEDMTIVDIQYYNELMTAFTLMDKTIDKETFPKLKQWYRRMRKTPEIKQTDKKFQEILQTHKICMVFPEEEESEEEQPEQEKPSED